MGALLVIPANYYELSVTTEHMKVVRWSLVPRMCAGPAGLIRACRLLFCRRYFR
jgi:hypothetical protein